MSDELEKLLAAATPGPWSEQDGSIGRFVKGRYEWSSIADVETAPDRDAAEGEGRANALLICAAVNALPELLEKVKRLEEALKPFAEIAQYDIGNSEANDDLFRPMMFNNRGPLLTVGMFRRARAALKETGQ